MFVWWLCHSSQKPQSTAHRIPGLIKRQLTGFYCPTLTVLKPCIVSPFYGPKYELCPPWKPPLALLSDRGLLLLLLHIYRHRHTQVFAKAIVKYLKIIFQMAHNGSGGAHLLAGWRFTKVNSY